MESNLIYILPAFGVVGLLYMLFLSSWVNKQPAGNEKMTMMMMGGGGGGGGGGGVVVVGLGGGKLGKRKFEIIISKL